MQGQVEYLKSDKLPYLYIRVKFKIETQVISEIETGPNMKVTKLPIKSK